MLLWKKSRPKQKKVDTPPPNKTKNHLHTVLFTQGELANLIPQQPCYPSNPVTSETCNHPVAFSLQQSVTHSLQSTHAFCPKEGPVTPPGFAKRGILKAMGTPFLMGHVFK